MNSEQSVLRVMKCPAPQSVLEVFGNRDKDSHAITYLGIRCSGGFMQDRAITHRAEATAGFRIEPEKGVYPAGITWAGSVVSFLRDAVQRNKTYSAIPDVVASRAPTRPANETKASEADRIRGTTAIPAEARAPSAQKIAKPSPAGVPWETVVFAAVLIAIGLSRRARVSA